MTKNLQLSPVGLAKVLLGMITLLLVANITAIYLKLAFGLSYNSFIGTFYFNKEANIPTLYSALSIMLAALLLWLIGNLPLERRQKQHLFWKALAGIFIFLGIDEFISIHETLTDNTRSLLGDFNGDGYLHFAWVVPYTFIFLVVLILMGRSFLRLPRKTRVMFLLAGSVFVSGAVGMELIGGRYIFIHGEAGREHLIHALMVTFEELLEMIGVVIFIYTLADFYLARVENQSIQLYVEMKRKTADARVQGLRTEGRMGVQRKHVAPPVS